MKTPIDIITGRVVDYDTATHELIIRARYDDRYTLEKRGYRECEIRLTDGRQLSRSQRGAIYAMLHEISDYTGQGLTETKTVLKRRFLNEELCQPDMKTFSLATCPMSLACAFQRYLVRFMLEFGIPSERPLLEYADDTSDYLYACLRAKKCCICGKPADLHHCEGSEVGMGRDRKEIPHLGLEAMPLCREHHSECHQVGQRIFNERYHLPGGIRLDEQLCRIYRLNGAGGNFEEEKDRC